MEKISQNIVGVIGCGGTVGHYVTEKLLLHGIKVIGAQRSEIDCFANNPLFSFFQLDILNDLRVCQFCDMCDVVVFCVSPSCLYGYRLAKIVGERNKVYIDATEELWGKDDLPQGGRYVMASGYVPGLFHYLPISVAGREFDETNRIILYSGGTELCSPAAFADIIFSEPGLTSRVIVNDAITPCNINMMETVRLPFFPKDIIVKPVLSPDYVYIKDKIGLKDVFCYSTFTDKTVLDFYFLVFRKIINKAKEEAVDIIRNLFQEKMTQHQVKDSYALIGFELTGKQGGQDKTVRCGLFLRNSSRMCGYCIAETVMSVMSGNLASGVYMASDVLDEGYYDRIRNELAEGEFLSVESIPVSQAVDPFSFCK